MRKRNPKLTRCTQGASTIEFALVAPVLFLLIFGFIELSLIFFNYLVLESATSITSRTGRTGYNNSTLDRPTFLRQEIGRLSQGIIDTQRLTISISVFAEFNELQPEPCVAPQTPPCPGTPGLDYLDSNGNGRWDDGNGSPGAGGPGDVVAYRVSYPWRILTPLLSQIIGRNGVYVIRTSAAVRNERF